MADAEGKDDAVKVDDLENDPNETPADPRHSSGLSYEEVVEDEEFDDEEVVEDEDNEYLEEEEVVEESDRTYEEEVVEEVDDENVEHEEILVDDEADDTMLIDTNQSDSPDVLDEKKNLDNNVFSSQQESVDEVDDENVEHEEVLVDDELDDTMLVDKNSDNNITSSQKESVEDADDENVEHEEILVDDEVDDTVLNTTNSPDLLDETKELDDDVSSPKQENIDSDVPNVGGSKHPDSEQNDVEDELPTTIAQNHEVDLVHLADDKLGNENIPGDESTEKLLPVVPPETDTFVGQNIQDNGDGKVSETTDAKVFGGDSTVPATNSNIIRSVDPPELIPEPIGLEDDNLHESKPLDPPGNDAADNTSTLPPRPETVFSATYHPPEHTTEKDDPTDEGMARMNENASIATNTSSAQALPPRPATGSGVVPNFKPSASYSSRPFDENEPTDEGLSRMNEIASNSENSQPKSTINAPALSTLSNEKNSVGAVNIGNIDHDEVEEEIEVRAEAEPVATSPFVAPSAETIVSPTNIDGEPTGNVSKDKANENDTSPFNSNETKDISSIEESPRVVANVATSSLHDNFPGSSGVDQTTIAESKDSSDHQVGGYCSSPFSKAFAVAICLLIIALVIALPLTLNNDDENDRDIILPPSTPSQSPQLTLPPSVASIPNLPLLTWVQAAETVNGEAGSGFGTSIAVDGAYIAIGAPLSSVGSVQTFESSGNELTIKNQVSGQEVDGQFGFSIDISDDKMTIGCPFCLAESSGFIPVGSVSFYMFQEASNQWTQNGPIIRGDGDIYTANEEFGFSVAVGNDGSSETLLLAVGAPKSSIGNIKERGRLYIFEGVNVEGNFSWVNKFADAPSLLGKSAYDHLGQSLDISSDGLRMIVGAPGDGKSHAGYVRVYVWSGSEWVVEFETEGLLDDFFGTSVTMLSASGDQFAVGAPGFEAGSGRILVFSSNSRARQGTAYIQLGQDIVGDPGERIGDKGSLTGRFTEDQSFLIYSTVSGVVYTSQYLSEAKVWVPSFEDLIAGSAGSVVRYFGNDSLVVAVPSEDAFSIYKVGNVTTFPPTVPIQITGSPVVTSTSAPSSAPIAGSIAPTTTNNSSIQWIQTGGSFTPRDAGWGYGAAVAVTSNTLAIGAPLALQNGAVFIHEFDESSSTWLSEAVDQVFGENEGDRFGAAVAMTDNLIAVGAPFVLVNGTATPSGAVYCYRKNNGSWIQVGTTLRGDPGVYAADEEFGSALAVSSNSLIVVGAKGSSLDVQSGRGRAYIFRYNDGLSDWTLDQDIAGASAGDQFGTAVDISSDGSHIIVGAPGKGYVTIYEYSGSEWLSIFTESNDLNESFGSSVKFLSDDGAIVAIGSPGSNSGAGTVTIFQQNGDSYSQLGEGIVGIPGESIGSFQLISGGLAIPSVVLGTALGEVKRYEFDQNSGVWVSNVGTVQTGFASLNQVASFDDSNSFVVSGDDDATIYTLQ